MGVGAVARARTVLLAAREADLRPGELCEEVIRAVRSVADFHWCALMTTDPATLLPSGGVVHGFPREACAPYWDNELLDPDFNKFVDLARRVDPVATLVEAVDGDLTRSPRVTGLYASLGIADELRVVFVAGSSCLATGTFVRPAHLGPFTAEELTDVRALVPVATSALRASLGSPHVTAPQAPPAVVLLDGEGAVTAMTEGASALLDDLRVSVDGELPGVLSIAATKARWSRAGTTVTTRVRGRSGRWLRLHVAPLAGDPSTVAATLDAARPDDTAQILLDSYGLTERETEIVLWLCRGLSAKEVASELLISPHTVRDHIKAIYEKAGVNSRGALVAGLFSDHLLDRFHDEVSHMDDLATN
ncbi:LuxR C-terminal-related transcriptional regulator [Iamia majanohamensis]|uniref:LuxR C-terminal-related transcriptional regulator n=1 Tax=Iamia majanohamensis TaxID=467976 RepID=A0AAE9Y7U6_9ACTN|nr:LuxR C-terminal-related transcriptional regulator [Iamia majanohamensis]WCO66043.1 LuxR C-terminal-related transcriptional regulator [Iamia majanohamensis]